jgi:hypothetical protein
MLMLVDTPDPRYRPESGRDGPGRPRPGVHTILLLAGSGTSLYLARAVGAASVEFLLLFASFTAFLAAIFSLWMHGGEPAEEEP